MKLIDKDALVAEIEKEKNLCRNIAEYVNTEYIQGRWKELKKILSIISTLEVREEDLEKKEIIDKACWWLNNNRLGVIDDDYIKEFRKAINN